MKKTKVSFWQQGKARKLQCVSAGKMKLALVHKCIWGWQHVSKAVFGERGEMWQQKSCELVSGSSRAASLWRWVWVSALGSIRGKIMRRCDLHCRRKNTRQTKRSNRRQAEWQGGNWDCAVRWGKNVLHKKPADEKILILKKLTERQITNQRKKQQTKVSLWRRKVMLEWEQI